MGQKPMTFIRQVIACICCPSLLENNTFPSDVRHRARMILTECYGRSIGSYTLANGMELIQKDVANYIEHRDGGIKADFENIFLSAGASESIRDVLRLFVETNNSSKIGIMVPIPQYPLYSATILEFGLYQINYYLNEDRGWTLEKAEMERSLNEAKNADCLPKVLCVINPGNPTSHVMSRNSIKMVIKFAHQNNLFLIADEVYQDNVFVDELPFHSFKKELMLMNAPCRSNVGLASFHSCSKGYIGECGLRGGYVEFVNVTEQFLTLFDKFSHTKICSTVIGQVALECLVNPPKVDDPSYIRWNQEKETTLSSLKKRANLLHNAFNSMPGISCNQIQGAIFAFPRIEMPQKAIDKAKALHMEVDYFYALELLESTGICIIPGNLFGQKLGTYHFRTTILPQFECMKNLLHLFKNFHTKFMDECK